MDNVFWGQKSKFMTLRILLTGLSILCIHMLIAQPKAKTVQQPASQQTLDLNAIPVSQADLGKFPYFKTLPAFEQNDSLTIEQNRTYFYDGQKYFTVDGKVSYQKLNARSSDQKMPSYFQIIQEFDRIVATLGGKKIYEGEFPDAPVKKLAGQDLVTLASNHQVTSSAYYGVAEYVIKTPEKEVWVQLEAKSILSRFYTLMVVEKQDQLITTNINKKNTILEDLEKNGKSTVYLDFALDSARILSQSGDEILNMAGIFQAHHDWKIKIEVHNAPVGKPGYIQSLTNARASAIKQELLSLGVNASSVSAAGLGDQKPVGDNDSEKGRKINTRVEISRI